MRVICSLALHFYRPGRIIAIGRNVRTTERETVETIRIGSLELTREEAERAGLLPEQRKARANAGAAFLRSIGHGNSEIALALAKYGEGTTR